MSKKLTRGRAGDVEAGAVILAVAADVAAAAGTAAVAIGAGGGAGVGAGAGAGVVQALGIGDTDLAAGGVTSSVLGCACERAGGAKRSSHASRLLSCSRVRFNSFLASS